MTIVLLGNLAIVLLLAPNTVGYLYSKVEVVPDIRQADAIVLLSSWSFDEIGDSRTYQRLFHAAKLFREGYADTLIIAGGKSENRAESLASTMRSMSIELGIPEGAIFVEERSLNTRENLMYSKPIMESIGIRDFLLVTSCSHMGRAMGVANKLGLSAYPAPVRCFEAGRNSFQWRLRFCYEVLREYGARIYFRLRGWT